MLRLSLMPMILGSLFGLTNAIPFNTFDGEGFPACRNVSTIYNPTSVDEMVAIVKNVSASSTPLRASGKGHMWYDTMCSDDPNTVIMVTELVAGISDFNLGATEGSVIIEAGVTFFQLAEYLHVRGASMGYALVNWNITIAGAAAMGAHRSSLREQSMVVAGVQSMDIIDGTGTIQTVVRNETDERWLAASTSLGLLGPIARMKFKIYPDTKVYAEQKTLTEEEVLNGDIYGLIAPYATANLWWWPYLRKFHQRYYDVVETNSTSQQGFQSTFSATEAEAGQAKAAMNAGKTNSSFNILVENAFFNAWELPNFREKTTQEPLPTWPVYGWNYDVLIGGLYPEQQPAWDYGMAMYTLELAIPVTLANALLKRVRELWDAELEKGIIMTSTYKSGINIKFGAPYEDLMGQAWSNGAKDGGDWSKGVIMFDFPSWVPTIGDKLRFNEPFYHNLAKTIIDEFPCRPHWTKNTRDVFTQSVKKLDPDHLSRFAAVRKTFDPQGIFKSIVGETIGVMGK